MGGDGGVIANQRRFVRGCEKGSLSLYTIGFVTFYYY